MVIFVGNLNFSVTSNDLKRLFIGHGVVQKAEVVSDDITRRSRGFGFVDMEDHNEAVRAIEKLHHTLFMDNVIVVTDKGPRHAVRSSFTPPQKKSK